MPDVAGRGVGRVGDGGHVLQPHRLAAGHAQHQLRHVVAVGQELAGGELGHAIGADPFAGLAGQVGRLQGAGQFVHGQAVAGQARRVQGNHQRALGRADGADIAGAGDALELVFQAVRHFGQFGRATLRVVGPQGQRHHRHIVDALGLDDRLAHAQVLRHPVLVGEHLVVQAYQRRLALHADFELHRQDRHARAADRIGVLDLLDLGQLLLQREGHHLLDLARVGAGEGHDDVGHGHVDLRLFLARGDGHRDQAQQQADQGQDRGQRVVLEDPCQAAGDAQAGAVGRVHLSSRPGARPPAPAQRPPDRWR